MATSTGTSGWANVVFATGIGCTAMGESEEQRRQSRHGVDLFHSAKQMVLGHGEGEMQWMRRGKVSSEVHAAEALCGG